MRIWARPAFLPANVRRKLSRRSRDGDGQTGSVGETPGPGPFPPRPEVLEDPRYAAEKWLIFSEHRDTVDFLVRHIEGLGCADQAAVIHGGIAWLEREEQVERFRELNGVRRSRRNRCSG